MPQRGFDDAIVGAGVIGLAHAYHLAMPAAGVTVVTGVGGAGMTLSFGLAEKIVKENLGED